MASRRSVVKPEGKIIFISLILLTLIGATFILFSSSKVKDDLESTKPEPEQQKKSNSMADPADKAKTGEFGPSVSANKSSDEIKHSSQNKITDSQNSSASPEPIGPSDSCQDSQDLPAAPQDEKDQVDLSDDTEKTVSPTKENSGFGEKLEESESEKVSSKNQHQEQEESGNQVTGPESENSSKETFEYQDVSPLFSSPKSKTIIKKEDKVFQESNEVSDSFDDESDAKTEEGKSYSDDTKEVFEMLLTEDEVMDTESAAKLLKYLIKKKKLNETLWLLQEYPEFYADEIADGQFLIHLAAKFDWPELLDELLNPVWIDVNQVTKDGNNNYPLHFAAQAGHSSAFAAKLVTFGAVVDAVNANGETPLFEAVINENYDVAEYMLTEAKANPNKLIVYPGSRNFKTILNAAILAKEIDMVKLLLEHKAEPYLVDSSKLDAFNTANTFGISGAKEFLKKYKVNNRTFIDEANADNDIVASNEDSYADLPLTRDRLNEFLKSGTGSIHQGPLTRIDVN